MSGARLAGGWLLGLGAGWMTVAAARGNLGGLAFPFLVGSGGFLLLARRLPVTDFELGLDGLLALLLPIRRATTAATVPVAIAHRTRLAGFRHGVRRWAKPLQLIKTDGYETPPA